VPAITDATLFGYEPPGPTVDAWKRMYHLFAFQRDTFLSRYHQRSNVETTFSMIKAKYVAPVEVRHGAGQ
jgi:hypothetical protein